MYKGSLKDFFLRYFAFDSYTIAKWLQYYLIFTDMNLH